LMPLRKSIELSRRLARPLLLVTAHLT
jgi:hypothetical protein